MNIKKNNKKGFTLVELLAVIVVLAIVMSLAVVAITNVLNNTRRSAFVSEAKSFISGAQDLVQSDDLNSMLGIEELGNYAPNCATETSTYIPLAAINLRNGGVTSPYGNSWVKGETTNVQTVQPTDYSFVKVTSNGNANNCVMTYSIFLYDGVYSIGEPASPIENNALKADNVHISSVQKKG